MNKFSRSTLVIAILVSLAACQSVQPPANVEPEAPTPADAPQQSSAPEPVVYRNFTKDELSRTLINEMGAHRGYLLDSTTDYVALAKETRDIAIIRRASQFAAALGDTDSLITLGELWLEEEPDSLEPHITLSYQLMETGRFVEAVDHMREILRQGGRIDFSTIATRTERITTEQRSDLIAHLANLREEFPNSRSLHYSLIQLLEQNEQASEAMSQLNLYRAEYGPSARSSLIEAQLLLKLSQTDQALAVLRKGIIDYPEHQLMRFNYARVLVQTENLVEARKQFTELSAMAPDDYETLYSLALLDLELNDIASAKSILERVLAAGYRTNDAHYYLAYISEQEGNDAEAIRHFQQVRSDANNFVNAQRQAINLLIKNNRAADAHNWVLQSSNGNPRLQALLTTIEADALESAGQSELALSVLSNAIEKYPSETELLFARALIHERIGDMTSQETDLRTIIELAPEDSRALNHLGYTLLISSERYEEALALIERAIAVSPDDPAIIDSLGWALFKLGRYDEALAHLQRAYADFRDAEVAAHLGETLWMMGRREAATQLWNEALSETPDSPILLEAVSRLTEGAGS